MGKAFRGMMLTLEWNGRKPRRAEDESTAARGHTFLRRFLL
jgi:hypothetical protein